MRKYFLSIIIIGVSFISCLSTPVNNSSYSTGNYNTGTINTRTTPSIPTVPSIIITKMDFVNRDENGTAIGSYGTIFESSTLKYLAPRITYDSIGAAGEIVLNIKIIYPDGSIDVVPSSPSGYSFNTTLTVQSDKKGSSVISTGWGNDKGGSYTPGTYNYEIWSKGKKLFSASFTVKTTSVGNQGTSSFTSLPKNTETELVFTLNGPEGINARLYYNGELIGTIVPEKTVKKTIPNNVNNFLLKAQIGDEIREFRLAAHGSTTIYLNIIARRTPSGIVISDFNIVNRTPLYIVKYVNIDGLNVRNNLNADAAVLDVLSQDCRVEILEEYTNNWVRIKYLGNKTGCVNGKYLTSTQPPFVITSLKVGNSSKDGSWLTNAGNTLYSSQMRYLTPVVNYDATYNGKGTFFVKIIQPNGTTFRNPSVSPSGFTFSNEPQVNRGNNQTLNLSSWGNNDTSSYQAGEWTVEIWHNNRRLWSEKITIR
ncbi:hypothetical protein FACS1894163_04690 [Spirochaetia bacterium]|nr:hypothetical protein FACS1894163_04690 [Spirochaetia bacterium]